MGMAPVDKSAMRGVQNLNASSPIMIRREMRKGISCKGWLRWQVAATLKCAYPELSETSLRMLADDAFRMGKLQS